MSDTVLHSPARAVAPASDRTGYRPDIDGLRALAIIPVVAYHYGFGMPGGFVGVDIFFVISGFLITGILLGDIDRHKYSIPRFYERRVRRIFPALFFMLAVATAASMWILLPPDLEGMGKGLATTVGFVSNFWFWKDATYFARAAATKPLLHTWSLAVEEQFYLFFPPLLWAIARLSRRHLPLVIAAGLAASLAIAIWAVKAYPGMAFYLLPPRGWELMIGALLATNAVPVSNSAVARHGASAAGLGLIAASVFLIDSASPFPGAAAIAPCAGAALVIYASLCGGGAGNSLLATKPLVGIGLISYSLYLWHWPIVVLAEHQLGTAIPLFGRIALAAAAMGLAAFSWRFVERPFRKRDGPVPAKPLWISAAAAAAVMFSCGVVLVLSHGLPQRVPPSVAKLVTPEVPFRDKCFKQTADEIQAGDLCWIGSSAERAPSFIVWGDSHASRFAAVIRDLAKASGRRGVVAASATCPPLIGVRTSIDDCDRFNNTVLDVVARQHIRSVILSGIWAYYAHGSKADEPLVNRRLIYLEDEQSKQRSSAENVRVLRRGLLRTVRRLELLHAQVTIIGPVPEMVFSVPEAMAHAEWKGLPPPPAPTFAEFLERQRPVLDDLVLVERMTHARVVYPHRILCRTVCAYSRQGEPLYIDDNHLSRLGLSVVTPMLSGLFNRGR